MPCQPVKSLPLKRTVNPSGACGGSAAWLAEETMVTVSSRAAIPKMRVSKGNLLDQCDWNASHPSNQRRLMRGSGKGFLDKVAGLLRMPRPVFKMACEAG